MQVVEAHGRIGVPSRARLDCGTGSLHWRVENRGAADHVFGR